MKIFGDLLPFIGFRKVDEFESAAMNLPMGTSVFSVEWFFGVWVLHIGKAPA